MSLRSSREAYLIGDIAEEAAKARSFVGDRDADALAADEPDFYGVQKAIQNAVEACVRVEREGYAGRFEELFEDFNFDELRRLGNLLRHDYGSLRADAIWETATTSMPKLGLRAERLLAAHRELHGGA